MIGKAQVEQEQMRVQMQRREIRIVAAQAEFHRAGNDAGFAVTGVDPAKAALGQDRCRGVQRVRLQIKAVQHLNRKGRNDPHVARPPDQITQACAAIRVSHDNLINVIEYHDVKAA